MKKITATDINGDMITFDDQDALNSFVLSSVVKNPHNRAAFKFKFGNGAEVKFEE